MENLTNNFGTVNQSLLVCKYKGWEIFDFGNSEYLARKRDYSNTVIWKETNTTVFGVIKEINRYEDELLNPVKGKADYYMPGISLDTNADTLLTLGDDSVRYYMPAVSIDTTTDVTAVDANSSGFTLELFPTIEMDAPELANRVVKLAKWSQD
jgi:hypothetical protein